MARVVAVAVVVAVEVAVALVVAVAVAVGVAVVVAVEVAVAAAAEARRLCGGGSLAAGRRWLSVMAAALRGLDGGGRGGAAAEA